ncbi:YihY/virulence factor BrkB family protein [Alicyclobacillus curvatus]|nr:YihY/virulence factor BrkB family protein [Alicyclobacillus curvatus]
MSSPNGVRRVARFLWTLTTSVVKHDIASLAAVIAFYAFFSLFPLLLLAIYALSVAVPQSSIETLLMDILRPYFPAMSDAQKIIATNLAQLSQGADVGIVSAVTLVWSATSGFIALQQALDIIYGNEQQRSFVIRRLVGFMMLLILLLLTLGSALVLSVFPVVRLNLATFPAILPWLLLIHALSRIVFPLSLILGFIISFRYLPSRRIDWVYLFPGALVAAFTLDVGRHVFVWYATHISKYKVIYGGLTTVMLLILWMYVGTMLVLFGAEVSAALEDELGREME